MSRVLYLQNVFNIGFHTYDKINRPVQTIRILRIIIDSFCASFRRYFWMSLSLSLEKKKANNRNNVKARRDKSRVINPAALYKCDASTRKLARTI